MEDEKVRSLNRPESYLTNPPGHLLRDEWTALSRPLSVWGGRQGTWGGWDALRRGARDSRQHLLARQWSHSVRVCEREGGHRVGACVRESGHTV